MSRALDRVRPGKGALYVTGVLLLVAAAFTTVAFVAWSILATRTDYFEQRNLRELDRVVADLNTTRESLAQVAALHFVPQQLHFSLSPQLECLVATTEITGAGRQPITINYAFVDPQATQSIAAWYARQTTALPADGGDAVPALASRPLPEELCAYQRPLGLELDELTRIGDGRIRVERTAQLSRLLGPMTAEPGAPAQSVADCAGRESAEGDSQAGGGLRDFIGRCLLAAATEDLRDQNYARRLPAEFARIAQDSIAAATSSNALRIQASTSTDALNLESALQVFDAVQIIAPSASEPLLKAGRVPAAIEGDDPEQIQLLNALLGFDTTPEAAARARTATQRAAAAIAAENAFVTESRVVRMNDLIIFQRTFPGLAGLDCNPCRIVGIVSRAKFDTTVRKIDGVQATMFLIGVLTLIALIPLIQLRLRRRLDATSRTGQYVLWFSLTLLAASATVSGFAIWTSAASRHAGASEAGAAIRQITAAFDHELSESIHAIGDLARGLGPNTSLFPAPTTLSEISRTARTEPATASPPLSPAAASAAPAASASGPPAAAARPEAATAEAAVTATADAPAGPRQPPAPAATAPAPADAEAKPPPAVAVQPGSDHPGAAIIESVSYFRGDGHIDRTSARFVAGRFPAFGTQIADRPYFLRARNRDYDRIEVPQCDQCRGVAFVLDRVPSRPDGAARFVLVLPDSSPCLQRMPDWRDLSDLSAATAIAPVYKEDVRQQAYYPPARQFAVASGTLRTFLGISLRPGFEYAVIDPQRPRGQPNVLFHSRPGAEFVERFEQEVDDPAGFQALVEQALARRGGGAPGAGERQTNAAFARLRIDTNYRAQTSRLTVARLHPQTDWVLVIIENRNDAGYAVWRAATFGYSVWLVSAAAAALFMMIVHMRAPRSLDRRPGLSLWPRRRLAGFTPPRLVRHDRMREQVTAAAIRRDHHVWWMLGAGLIGIFAAEGGSRVLIAFAAAAAALAGSAYFRGKLAEDDEAAMRNDRWLILFALALAVAELPLFLIEIVNEYAFRRAADESVEWAGALGRTLLILMAVAILIRWLLVALAHSLGRLPRRRGAVGRLFAWMNRVQAPRPAKATADAAPAAGAGGAGGEAGRGRRGRLPFLVRSGLGFVDRQRPHTDIAWIIALLVLGGLPAASGFLDSYDQDRLLLAERARQVGARYLEQRRDAVVAINQARLAKLPEPEIAEIVTRPVAIGRIVTAPPPDPDARAVRLDWCNTLSCLAINSLGLREQAVEYSDFAPFHMFDAVSLRDGWSPLVILALEVSLPLLVLFLALTVFRQQYFRRPPLLSPGKDPEFDPPLSITRASFVSDALLPAAAGREPALPLQPAGGRRHLILGAGFDLRNDWAPDGTRRLGDVPGISWIDLLSPPERLDNLGKAVVIGNFDMALLVPDDGRTMREAYRVIRDIAHPAPRAGKTAPRIERHVFLLADIDPIDRIGLLWARQAREEAGSLVESWRWAELLQAFTMIPIQRAGPIDDVADDSRMLRAIHEELSVLDTSFAEELREELLDKMRAAPPRSPRDDRAEADRIVSFISEQMSDHYYQIWASSSDEERVILFRTARDCHLKMPDSRALRSLLARGLLIRIPEYRLMNRSFARYVSRVGARDEIRMSAERVGGVDWVWPLIRYPLVAIAGAAVLLLQFIAPSGASGAIGALPALLALVPTLLGRWFQDRAGAA